MVYVSVNRRKSNKKRMIRIEKDFNETDKIVPEILISDENYEMSLFSVLFPLWTGSHRKIRGGKGRISDRLENPEMQSIFKGRI